ncbi:MAG: PD-(D/E)XK nuclease family protein [Candidatus Taylorbacteria bacterium]
MSEYYTANMGSGWNYGGKNWKLSRSKIDLFMKCPRCFYIDNKLGVKQVPPYPFSLNSAVDHLLKQEFDVHRAKGEQHPLQKEYGIDAMPAKHAEIDEWRRNFGGVRYLHESTGMLVTGAIDDLWIDSKGDYIVVDYKATAKDEAVKELNQAWQDGYKRQMEVYQWLLRRNGLTVSDTGYFVYCTGKTDMAAFDKKIDFDINLIPYNGDDSWVEGTLSKIKECLEAKTIPESKEDCDFCAYWNARRKFEK